MAVTGICAALAGAVHVLPVFLVALPLWGFAFWMGIPGAFSLLAERSNYPEERAGDAQSVMAFGRVFGPWLGGLVYDRSPAALGLAAGGVMVAGSVLLVYVEWRVRPHVITGLIGNAT
jgi:DHA1 family inner membrane transport protein